MSEKKFSFFRFIVYLLILVMAAGMCVFVYLSWKPRDLADIDGREEKPEEAAVDLLEKMQAAKNGAYEITITEEEINRYLASRLKLKQVGFTDEYVKVKGVYVDLKPEHAEVVILREIDYVTKDEDGNEKRDLPFFPMDQTVSMKFKIYTDDLEDGSTGNRVEFPPGSFGQVPAPGQFVLLVKPSYDAMYEYFIKEIDLGYKQMSKIEIGDGFIKLDPRPRTREVTLQRQ